MNRYLSTNATPKRQLTQAEAIAVFRKARKEGDARRKREARASIEPVRMRPLADTLVGVSIIMLSMTAIMVTVTLYLGFAA